MWSNSSRSREPQSTHRLPSRRQTSWVITPDQSILRVQPSFVGYRPTVSAVADVRLLAMPAVPLAIG